MRVYQIICPKCRASMKSKAGVPVGQRLACPKCDFKFAVEAPDEADIVDDADVVDDAEVIEDFDVEEAPPARKKGPPPPPAGKKKPSRRDEEEDEDDEPPARKKKSRRDEDEDEDEPASRKKKSRARDEEDEDDDRPRKSKKKKRRDEDEEEVGLYTRLKSNVLVRVTTLIILLGILAVMAYLLYEKKQREAEDNSNAAPVPALARQGPGLPLT